MLNKKTIIIGVSVVLVVAVIAVSLLLSRDNSQSSLPTVNENTFAENTSDDTVDFSDVELPGVEDDPGIPVSEEELAVTPEEEAEVKEIEAKQAEDIKSVEKSQEDIDADNAKIKKAAEEAAENSDVVEPVQVKPVETQPVEEEPEKDANGYIYTKEEAIKVFTSNADAMSQVKDPENKEYAMEEHGVTEEEYEALLNQLLTDPTSSTILAPWFDEFRKTGNMNAWIGKSASWLSLGGDDGDWADRITQ